LIVSGTVSVAIGLLLLLTVPHVTFLDSNIRADTRDRMVQWLRKQQLEGTAILLAQDVWFAEPDKKMLQAETIKPELTNLHELLDKRAGERSIVVVPQYTGPPVTRHRVNAANQRIMSLSQRAGANKEYELEGDEVSIAASANDRAPPKRNPSLTAYSVGPKGL
jgi:hypothetical protein